MTKQLITVSIFVPLIITASLVSVHQIKVNDTKQNITILADQVSEANIRHTIEDLSAFHTRFYNSQTGKEAAEYLAKRAKDIAKARPEVTVELFQHDWLMPSVIVTIPGSSKPNELVVLGAHADGINWTGTDAPSRNGPKDPTLRSPGSDDNASGCATILEALTVLMSSGHRPARTVQFMFFSGEEMGLLGSMAIAKSYKDLHKDVKAMIQFDMVLWPSGRINFINDYVSKDLTKSTRELATSMGIENSEGPCGYPCSDHGSFTKYGYPSVFPFEAPFGKDDPYVHTANDTLENAGGTSQAPKFAKLAIGFIVKNAN